MLPVIVPSVTLCGHALFLFNGEAVLGERFHGTKCGRGDVGLAGRRASAKHTCSKLKKDACTICLCRQSFVNLLNPVAVLILVNIVEKKGNIVRF